MSEITKIRDRMPVISADGRAIGLVAHAAGDEVRVTSVKDGRGFDHLIPLDWIAEVGKYVFLNKSRRFVRSHWENADPRRGGHRRAA